MIDLYDARDGIDRLVAEMMVTTRKKTGIELAQLLANSADRLLKHSERDLAEGVLYSLHLLEAACPCFIVIEQRDGNDEAVGVTLRQTDYEKHVHITEPQE